MQCFLTRRAEFVADSTDGDDQRIVMHRPPLDDLSPCGIYDRGQMDQPVGTVEPV
jgi:hypothetical protein